MLLRNPASSRLSRSRQDSITSPMRRSFALFRDVWGEVQSRRVGFSLPLIGHPSLKAYVTSFPRLKAMTGPPPAGSVPATLRWRHGRLKPVPFMWPCRDDCRRAPTYPPTSRTPRLRLAGRHFHLTIARRYGRCKMNQAGRSELPSISSPSDCLPRLESARCPKANCPPIGGATKNSRAVFERVTSESGERRSYRKFCAGGTRPKRLDDPACICGLPPSSVCLASALPR